MELRRQYCIFPVDVRGLRLYNHKKVHVHQTRYTRFYEYYARINRIENACYSILCIMYPTKKVVRFVCLSVFCYIQVQSTGTRII